MNDAHGMERWRLWLAVVIATFVAEPPSLRRWLRDWYEGPWINSPPEVWLHNHRLDWVCFRMGKILGSFY